MPILCFVPRFPYSSRAYGSVVRTLAIKLRHFKHLGITASFRDHKNTSGIRAINAQMHPPMTVKDLNISILNWLIGAPARIMGIYKFPGQSYVCFLDPWLHWKSTYQVTFWIGSPGRCSHCRNAFLVPRR